MGSTSIRIQITYPMHPGLEENTSLPNPTSYARWYFHTSTIPVVLSPWPYIENVKHQAKYYIVDTTLSPKSRSITMRYKNEPRTQGYNNKLIRLHYTKHLSSGEGVVLKCPGKAIARYIGVHRARRARHSL